MTKYATGGQNEPIQLVQLVTDTGAMVDGGARVGVVGVGTLGSDNGAASPVGFAQEGSTVPRALASDLFNFNGVSWDRQRNNQDLTLLTSAVRSATTASADQVNYNAQGVTVFFGVTAVSGVSGESITLHVEIKDPVSGSWQPIYTGAAETVANITRRYFIYPGAVIGSGVASAAVGLPLPRLWRVRVQHAGTGNFTYSVGASLTV